MMKNSVVLVMSYASNTTTRHIDKLIVLCVFSLSLFLGNGLSYAQQKTIKSTKKKPPTAKLSGLLQTATGWTSLDNTALDSRPFLSVSRARFWVRGSVMKRSSYMLHFAFDRIGADQNALLQGKSLSDSRAPVIQDAMIHLHLLPKQQLVLTSGFFRPTVGHENNGVVITFPNLEPAFSSTLVRRATVGKGHGRSTGFNLGHLSHFAAYSLQLHLGLFMPKGNYDTTIPNQEEKVSPLITSTIQVGWGNRRQMKNQNLLFMFNPLRQGRSIFIGGTVAHQGKDSNLQKSQVFTIYGTFQFDNLLFDTEQVQAKRYGLKGQTLTNHAWHIRMGYNLKVAGRYLTPFVLYTEMQGDQISLEEWTNKEMDSLNLFVGDSQLVDLGVHYHLDKRRLRLGLHGLYSTHSKEAFTRLPSRQGWSGLLTIHMHI